MIPVYCQGKLLGHLQPKDFHRRPYFKYPLYKRIALPWRSPHEGRWGPTLELEYIEFKHHGDSYSVKSKDITNLHRIRDFSPEDAALPILMEKS